MDDTLGLTISFLVTFLLLPSLISLLAVENEVGLKDTEKSLITSSLELLLNIMVLYLGLLF